MSIKYNMVMQQSADFNASFQINDANSNPIDMSVMNIQSQMVHEYGGNTPYSFICNGYSNGQMILHMPASNTAVINASVYVYDVEVQDPSNNFVRIVEGQVIVTPAVTQFQFSNGSII